MKLNILATALAAVDPTLAARAQEAERAEQTAQARADEARAERAAKWRRDVAIQALLRANAAVAQAKARKRAVRPLREEAAEANALVQATVAAVRAVRG